MYQLRFHFRDEGGSVSHCRFSISGSGGAIDGAAAAAYALALAALLGALTDAALFKLEILHTTQLTGVAEPAAGSDNSVSACLLYLDTGSNYHQILIPSPTPPLFLLTGPWAAVLVDDTNAALLAWNASVIASILRSADGLALASYHAGVKEIR
jgi:hypothetical protein